jgi:hypothetical protein
MCILWQRNKLKNIKIGIVFVFLISVAGGFFYLGKTSIKEDAVCKALRNIPDDEKCFLDLFFRILLLRDSGAYVLNGSKPAAQSSFLGAKYYHTTIHWIGYKRSTIFRKGYEIWKKYEPLFPCNNYCFCYVEDEEEDSITVFLINKKNFTDIVAKNIEDFKKVLGSKINPDIFLDMIINKKQSFFKILNNHKLFGVIFGYGKHNAELFHRRHYLLENGFFRNQNLIEKEIEKITEKLQVSHDERSYLLFSSLPSFVCDPTDPETQELQVSYKRQRKEFNNLYKNGNFLEITLRKLGS